MTDRAFESPDPFAEFLPTAPSPGPAQEEDDPFAPFLPQPEAPSSFGAFRRSAARSALPAIGSLPAMGAGAELGGVAGTVVGGPVGGAIGGVVGGLAGAIGGASAIDAAQSWALKALPESWTDALGLSERQQKLDQEGAPVASFLGGLAPYAITMRPGGFAKKTLPENSTALERIMAHPATARVFGAGVMGGMELGQEAIQGEQPDWTKVGIATGFGLVFNKPTRIGEAITEIGARPVRRALGRPEPVAPVSNETPETTSPAPEVTTAQPEVTTAPSGIAPTLFHAPPRAEASTSAQPTIADAADLGVMGPGHTEATFQGSHKPDPASVEAAREAKRTEQSVIGPDPASPDVHSVARQMHFDLFNEYDALRARRRALEAEPGAAAHLAETEAELARLEPEVRAANRRAAEAVGQPVVDAEAPSVAPEAGIDAQKATIAEDVTRQLMAAGVPREVAEATAHLEAANTVWRAQNNPALGTPEELYRREGAIIRAAQIRAKMKTPANARAFDDFQQRMAVGREQAQRRRNEGTSAVRIMTPEQRYAGVTKEEFEAAKHDAIEAAPDLRSLMTEDDWEFMGGQEFHQIEAYHGSPHHFERFDVSKIGTGEGAQAYGHGLYFAENEGVAKQYRSALSKGAVDWDDPHAIAAHFVDAANGNRDDAIFQSKTHVGIKNFDALKKAQDIIESGAPVGESRAGALYRVSLKPDKEDLLDWDKPLSEQSPKVQEAIKPLLKDKINREAIEGKFGQPLTGQTFYEGLQFDTREEQSKALSEAGIPGIKYADAGSRGAEGGTHNFVIFDDKDVEITHRNGEALSEQDRADAVRELEQRGRGVVQGGIVLNPEGIPGRNFLGVEGIKPILKIMREGNASTALHEFGHKWLAQLLRDSLHPQASDALKADARTVLDWFKTESADTITKKHHEQFARGVEEYMREGRAPTPALARVFAKFKAWLTSIYKELKDLGPDHVPITDDIRRVFDRMLSAEPQRTVIAPEREVRPNLSDIHKADIAELVPHEAEPVSDRIDAEADRYETENPHAPEFESVEAELAAARAAEPSGEARPDAVEAGANGSPDTVGPTERPGAGGGDQDQGKPPSGVGGTENGPAVRSGEREAGRERSESVPLAGRPAPDLTIGGQSFNVGKDGNVRAENISSREQFVAAINESSERIPGGGPLTMGEMQGLADDLALDPKTLDESRLASLFGGIQNLSSKIYALRQTIKAQSETVFNAMRNVQETGTDQATMEFALEAGRLDMMMSALSSVTTEVGRGLGMSFKNLEGWQKAADLNEFLKANTGKTLFQLKMVAKLGSQLDSPAKVAKYLRDAGKRSFGGMILEYWINGLISGIATHSTYAVGNTILTIEKMGPETAAAAMIGAARRAMGRQGETVRLGEVGAHFAGAARNLPAAVQAGIEGLRSGMTTLLPGEAARPLIPFAGDTSLVTARTIGNQPVSWGEVGADLFGLVRGMRDGVVSSAALIKAGGQAGAPVVGLSYSPLGQIPDIAYRGVPVLPVGSAIRVPGRFIAAIHSFFRTTNYSIYKAGGAYRTATSEGLNGTAFDARVADIHQNPPEAMMEAWRNEATETALMGHVGKFGQALSNLTNVEFNLPVLGGVRLLKFIDPFVHISSNVLKQTVMLRTPAGLLSAEIRADLSGKNGTIAQDTATARMLVGSALSITFGGLAAEGLITGSGPSDPHEAAMWREVYQPHSVRIGDMWYQVNRLGPMGMLLGIAADLYAVAHDATEGDVLKAAAHLQHAFTQNILDESFMRGPADLIKAVEDPGRYGEGYIKNFLSSFVPFSVGMAQIARASDPYSRQARNVMDAVRAKVPGYSQDLLPRRNIWGEEVPNLPALGGRAVSALYEQRVNSDPVNQAMVDLGIHPAAVERKIRNVELTDQQYDDFARVAGRMAKQRLDIIVRAPDWQSWPNHVRHDVISEVIRQSRETARGITMMKYAQIPRDAAEALRKKKTGEK